MATSTNTVQASVANPNAKKPDITADIFKSVLTLTFSHGKTLEIDVTKLTPEMQLQAMLHGVKQKLVDAGAISRDTLSGKSATISDKYEAVADVFMRITSETPTWNKVREGGVAGGNSGLLGKALLQLSGGTKTKADIDAFLASKSKEEKAAMRKNQKVAVVILELQQQGANDDLDTDAMLGDLLGTNMDAVAESKSDAEVEEIAPVAEANKSTKPAKGKK